jgi:hypothetical protein
MPDNTRVTLSATGLVNPGGKFEVLAMTVGEGNGWEFSEEVLRASLELWQGVECFVDHAGWFGGRSVRDLGGVCDSPRWSDDSGGIMLDLQTLGPSGELVDELGRQILAEEQPPKVGFSADILFTAKGKIAKTILRVLDLSLVFNPARGGAFVRAMNQIQGNTEVNEMPEEEVITTQSASTGGTAAQLAEDQAAIQELQEQTAHQEHLAAEAEEARKARIQMCAYLLDSGLNASQLPEAMREHVRKQFDGQVFTAQELNDAIDDARGLVTEMQGSGAVRGPTVSGMYDTADQLQAAVDDMLNATRDEGSESLQPARLSGIKELYMMMTGDRNLYGGYYPEHVQLATTANFTGLVKNAMNKIVSDTWDQLGKAGYDWWYRVTAQEHFETLNDVTGILVGTVGSLPEVAEGGEYTELKVGDSPETKAFTKYGGYIPLTLELIDRDNTRKLAIYPRELAKAGIRKVSSLVSEVFSSNAGVGPDMADTGALFNATAVTTLGGHANLLTTALSGAQWEVVGNAVYSQPMLIAQEAGYYGTGDKMALDPRFLLVHRDLRLTAMRILYPSWEREATIHSENLQQQVMGDVVVVPEWTDKTDWAAVIDPALVPGIVVCERFGMLPEVFIAGNELSPAVFMNDEHRIKVRHFVAVLVQDFRPLHKSNV